MTLSSLQKKMSTTNSLVLLFLVGLLSLTFLVLKISNAYAVANPPDGATVTTTALTAQSIRVTLVPHAGDTSTVWSLAVSTNTVTRTVVNVTTPTTTLTYDFTGLATNTPYYLAVASGDGVVTSSYITSTAVYTLADTPGTPIKSSTSTTSFTVTINSSSNPATTTFVVRDTGGATLQYLQSNGTWGAASSSFTAVRLGAINGTSTTGLTANPPHTISVAAVNGAGVTTSFSTAAATFYTLANTPSSPAVSAGANSLTFTWSGDATQYLAADDTAGTNSGLIAGTSYTINGVNCGTTRSFSVSGRNGDGVATATSTSASGTTSACGGGISVGGSGGGMDAHTNPFDHAVPATPAVPGVTPAVPATPASGNSSGSSLSSASSVAVFVHTLNTGSKGNEVKQLQQKLRELGYFTYPTNTGNFGPATRAAVVAFQKTMGLKPYPGHVGPGTRAALNSL